MIIPIYRTTNLLRARVIKHTVVWLAILSLSWGCALAGTTNNSPDPRSAAKAAPWPHGGMVSVANPYAAEAAADVLRRGGHAVDAAIAAHAVLGLVEPQSSGLGGGAFMLVYDKGKVYAYDGRETAPSGATDNLFIVDGEPLNFLRAWQSGRAVGTPGVPALYELVHGKHGKRDMAENLAAAIQLAEEGFVVSPRLAFLLERVAGPSRLDDNPATAGYFYPAGQALQAGMRRDNPAYAQTLRQLAQAGAETFYQGELAQAMVDAVAAQPLPGTLSLSDLANYQAVEREPICGSIGEASICTMPPPSSGLTQIMILALYDALTDQPGELDLDALVDAQRLAYADRDHYVADADHVFVPSAALIDPKYLDARAKQKFAPSAEPVPGDPGAVISNTPVRGMWGEDTTTEPAGTTHLSIIDQAGNAVSMTATVEAPFGSSRWAGGFLLNNEMTDFARNPTLGGKAVANQAKPGKRPRSSMSPVFVFDKNGQLKVVAGSPGGNSIIAYVAKTLVGLLRVGLTPQAAVDLPNIIARGKTVRVETGIGSGADIAAQLKKLGYPVQEREGENSGLHVIVVTDQGLAGAADSRREGVVIAVP